MRAGPIVFIYSKTYWTQVAQCISRLFFPCDWIEKISFLTVKINHLFVKAMDKSINLFRLVYPETENKN